MKGWQRGSDHGAAACAAPPVAGHLVGGAR